MAANEDYGEFYTSIGEFGVKIQTISAGQHDVENQTFG